jgi:hypothetical protein
MGTLYKINSWTLVLASSGEGTWQSNVPPPRHSVPRRSSASTMMECRVGDIAMMICKSTVWCRHARRHALRQYLTGSVHIGVAMIVWKETRERSPGPRHQRAAHLCIECSRKMLIRHTHTWLILRILAEWDIASLGVNIVNYISANIYITKHWNIWTLSSHRRNSRTVFFSSLNVFKIWNYNILR